MPSGMSRIYHSPRVQMIVQFGLSTHPLDLHSNKIQSALGKIEMWSQLWGFKISAFKTKAIIFSRRKIIIGSLQKLTLFGRDIEFSDQITFLGMTLDKKLTWGEHIKKLIEKCNKDLNLMRLVSDTTYGADKKILLTLCKALILSKIDYGAQAYNLASKPLLSKLDIIQNHALRIATRATLAIHSRTHAYTPENKHRS